jgi:hypothetical protein
MDHIEQKICLILLVMVLAVTCKSQNENQKLNNAITITDRTPAVSGHFYPGDSTELLKVITKLYYDAEQKKYQGIRAIIVPHAGYIFSGSVAASGYNQVGFNRKIDNVFILASSHRAYFEGASIYAYGNYITPLGEVKINHAIANKLRLESKYFSYVSLAHTTEHSLEVQLPLLQYKMGDDLSIVPIVIGTQSKNECRKIAQALKPYFIPENLFVISSDFSHYPAYKDAISWDEKTANAILLNSPEEFLAAIDDKKDDIVENMSTRACGWTSLLTLLYLTEDNSGLSYHKLVYTNSGDSEFGDKQRVVGYHSLVLTDAQQHDNQPSSFSLTEQDKTQLLMIARETLVTYINFNEIREFDTSNFSENLQMNIGAFVTLTKNNKLRGCIGRFISDDPVYKVVQHMAIASATKDSRFLPVSKNEFDDLEIEISVLTPLREIESIDEIELGKHGIYIKKGYQTGTLLPQVATENQWNKEEFLGHCARDKARIGWDGWKNAELFVYEAIVFSDNQ